VYIYVKLPFKDLNSDSYPSSPQKNFVLIN